MVIDMLNFLMVYIIFYVFRSYSYELFSRATDMLSLKGYIPKSKNSKENLYTALQSKRIVQFEHLAIMY